MLRALTVVRSPAVKEDRVADTAWLDHTARGSSHAKLRGHGGLEFRLDLDRAAVLNDGDAVKLEDGRLVRVRAAPQRLLEIRAENPLRLLRFAWQLGQRHAAAELKGDVIYLEHDHALAELARGQGCSVSEVTRPFHPERAEEHACDHHDHGPAGHDHGDAHDHNHTQGHDHHAHAHGHEHEGGCGCHHGHKHEH